MDDLIAPVISGAVGAAVGFALRAPFDAYLTRRRRQRDARIALVKIRDRLRGIQSLVSQLPAGVDPFDDALRDPSPGLQCKVVRDEVWKLGSEKDEYLRTTDRPDQRMQLGVQRILLQHDLSGIDDLVSAIGRRLGE